MSCFKSQPYKLVSLMELLKLNAEAFCRASTVIGQAWVLVNRTGDLSATDAGTLGAALGELQRECETLELPSATVQIGRMRQWLDAGSGDLHVLTQMLVELQNRVIDELSTRFFLAVPLQKRHYYEQPEAVLGPEIVKAFPSATDDIAEAGKCFSLSRYTACVFHLSRIVEAGLRVLTIEIGVKLKHDWGAQLQEIEKELETRYKAAGARTPDDLFFSETASQIGHIKNAWRNPTMHIERRFNEEVALDIFNAVKAFMRHISVRLKEAVPEAT